MKGAFTANVTNADVDNLNAIPEPSPLLLFGRGLMGLGLWRKFKK